jgi:hypothetical protein
MAVTEYSATDNFSEDLLRMNKTKDAIITAGVAPR